MSEGTTDAGNGGQGTQAGAAAQAPGQAQGQAQGQQQAAYTPPATQADLDRIVTERLTRERAKFADYDDLKTKASEFDKLSEASKTDQQRLEERASKAEGRIGPLEIENAKLMIALDKGLSLGDAKRLVGNTREELEADAEQFLKDHPRGQQQQTADLRAAAGQGAPAGSGGTADDWLRRMAGRGQ